MQSASIKSDYLIINTQCISLFKYGTHTHTHTVITHMYIAGDDPERFLLFVKEAEILSDSAQINCVITQYLGWFNVILFRVFWLLFCTRVHSSHISVIDYPCDHVFTVFFKNVTSMIITTNRTVHFKKWKSLLKFSSQSEYLHSTPPGMWRIMLLQLICALHNKI